MKIRKTTWVMISFAIINMAFPICFPESLNVVTCVCGWLCYILISIDCNFKDNYIDEQAETIQQMDSTLRDIVRRVKADFVDDIKVEQQGNQGEYDYYFAKDGIWVVYCRHTGEAIHIKFYPFNDDKDFAELQAEELCDKLNEKI